MKTILFLGFLALIVGFWFETQRLREFVIARCKRICKKADLQLLDQTVALVSVSVQRGTDRLPHIHRKYQFEVSENGLDRYCGYVNMLGKYIISIQFDGPDDNNIFLQSEETTIH